jgi:hypothetical protein
MGTHGCPIDKTCEEMPERTSRREEGERWMKHYFAIFFTK